MKRKVLFIFLILGVIVLGKLSLSMINNVKASALSPFPTIIICDAGDDGSAGWLGVGNDSTSEK